jgi:hypothetical protein
MTEPVVTFSERLINLATTWSPVLICVAIIAVAAYVAYKAYKKRR